MKEIKKQKIEEFLNDLSSNAPAPGGGSVAALAGALSAGLVCMVCRLTIGKKKYASVEREMKIILRQSEGLRKKFARLAEEDKRAFLNVIKNKYSKASLRKAGVVPARTARLAGEISVLAELVLKKGNRKVVSDSKIAVELAKLVQKGALLNVKANS